MATSETRSGFARSRTAPARDQCGAAHCTRTGRLVATRDGWRCKRCSDRMPSHRRRPAKESRQ